MYWMLVIQKIIIKGYFQNHNANSWKQSVDYKTCDISFYINNCISSKIHDVIEQYVSSAIVATIPELVF